MRRPTLYGLPTPAEHVLRCEPHERTWGIFTRCTAEDDDLDRDPFTNALSTVSFEAGFGRPQLPIIKNPVCPPRLISMQAAVIWEQMADIDRLRTRFDRDEFVEYLARPRARSTRPGARYAPPPPAR